mmetsp:Transcript_46580/g.141097  ORF Transcript_46580/g.141097 Transcript_46580/m.141097 type:complete len:94 (+) Transcript_46580:133-414(+)
MRALVEQRETSLKKGIGEGALLRAYLIFYSVVKIRELIILADPTIPSDTRTQIQVQENGPTRLVSFDILPMLDHDFTNALKCMPLQLNIVVLD